MIVSNCTHEAVLHVVRNMRERDKEEIYNVRHTDCPFALMNDVMAQASFSWVAWLDERPAAVFGGAPRHPGVWSMYAFATDQFPRLALGLTRFGRNTIIPMIFDKLNGHRLQCDSHEKHTTAHRWLEALGASKESVKKNYGRDGANYFTYVVLKKSTNATKSSILSV